MGGSLMTNDAVDAWLARFKRTAAAQGISPATIDTTLTGLTYDPTVVRLDRSQRSFKLSFEEFYARRVGSALIKRGQNLMRTHRATLDRVEKRFGVPAEIIIAIWGLETNYGHAGRTYAAYVASHVDEVRAKLAAMLKVVSDDLNMQQEERYYATTIATITFSKFWRTIGMLPSA